MTDEVRGGRGEEIMTLWFADIQRGIWRLHPARAQSILSVNPLNPLTASCLKLALPHDSLLQRGQNHQKEGAVSSCTPQPRVPWLSVCGYSATDWRAILTDSGFRFACLHRKDSSLEMQMCSLLSSCPPPTSNQVSRVISLVCVHVYLSQQSWFSA